MCKIQKFSHLPKKVAEWNNEIKKMNYRFQSLTWSACNYIHNICLVAILFICAYVHNFLNLAKSTPRLHLWSEDILKSKQLPAGFTKNYWSVKIWLTKEEKSEHYKTKEKYIENSRGKKCLVRIGLWDEMTQLVSTFHYHAFPLI